MKRISLLSLLLITGCMPKTYYRPSAISGEIVPVSLHAIEMIHFNSANGAAITVDAEPKGKDTLLRLTALAHTNEWMQFSSDSIEISDTTGRPARRIQIPGFESFILTKTGGTRGVRGALDKLETPNFAFDLCQFSAEMRIPDFRPKQFLVSLPSLIVDGTPQEFPTITFESRVGMEFWTDGP